MNKTFKKVLALGLVLVMVLGMASCGSGKNEDTDKKAVLVVSFGSSFIENREAAIDATENVIKEEFKDYDFYRAFTAQTIIDIYKDRDKVDIDNVEQAMEKIYKEGYGEVLVVPTLIFNGAEKDEMLAGIETFKDKFAKLTISTPLLNEYNDYVALTKAMKKEMPKDEGNNAVVLMGHGSHHPGNSAYGMLDYVFKDEGMNNVYVGTVEGFPTFDTVKKELKVGNYSKVTLIPAMLVAGDHAHNDMAGDEADSWKNLLKAEGYDVDIMLKGLGELPEIQKLFVEHAHASLEAK